MLSALIGFMKKKALSFNLEDIAILYRLFNFKYHSNLFKLKILLQELLALPPSWLRIFADTALAQTTDGGCIQDIHDIVGRYFQIKDLSSLVLLIRCCRRFIFKNFKYADLFRKANGSERNVSKVVEILTAPA